MIKTSREYRETILNNRHFLVKITMHFSNGKSLELDNSNIMQNTLSFDDGVSEQGKFSVGAAIINKCSFQLSNFKGEFNTHDFVDAEIKPFVGLQLVDEVEWLAKGVFTVESAKSKGNTISIEAFDNMVKLEKPYTESNLMYPARLWDIVKDICICCGISLATPDFDNNEFIVNQRPEGDGLNFRMMLAYCAQAAGCYARMDNAGQLAVKWYDFSSFDSAVSGLDGGNFEDYTSGDNADGGNFTNYSSGDTFDGGNFKSLATYHHIYSIANKEIETDDIIITGIEVVEHSPANSMESDEQLGRYLYGELGYVLLIKENPLIQQGKARETATYLGGKLVGLKFRPMSVSFLSDPCIEAGDVVFLSDNKGNSYQTIISNTKFTLGQYQSFTADAETPSARNAYRSTTGDLLLQEIKKDVEETLSIYEQASRQLTDTMANALGFYTTEIKNSDGSTTSFMHDKQKLSESRTIWKKTIEGFAVSQDGGTTWQAGFGSDGSIVAKIMQANKVEADFIETGSLSSRNWDTKKEGFQLNLDNGTITSKNLTLDTTGLITLQKALIKDGSLEVTTTGGKEIFTANENGFTSSNFIIEPSGKVSMNEAEINGGEFHVQVRDPQDNNMYTVFHVSKDGFMIGPQGRVITYAYGEMHVNIPSINSETITVKTITNGTNTPPKITGGYTGTINGAKFVNGICTGKA